MSVSLPPFWRCPALVKREGAFGKELNQKGEGAIILCQRVYGNQNPHDIIISKPGTSGRCWVLIKYWKKLEGGKSYHI
jgi:hypothetical protein